MRIEIESLVEGVDVSETVTRARFEELCADLFRQTLVPVEQVMPPHTSPYLPISRPKQGGISALLALRPVDLARSLGGEIEAPLLSVRPRHLPPELPAPPPPGAPRGLSGAQLPHARCCGARARGASCALPALPALATTAPLR